MKVPISRASNKQIKYIEDLFGIGIDRHRRNTQLSLWLGREIHFLDELSIKEANQVIQKLYWRSRKMNLEEAVKVLNSRIHTCRERWNPTLEDSIGVQYGNYKRHDVYCCVCVPIIALLKELIKLRRIDGTTTDL